MKAIWKIVRKQNAGAHSRLVRRLRAGNSMQQYTILGEASIHLSVEADRPEEALSPGVVSLLHPGSKETVFERRMTDGAFQGLHLVYAMVSDVLPTQIL